MEVRWIVREERFGKFGLKQTICCTYDLQNAAFIIRSMLETHKGQPVRYKAEKVAQTYIPAIDDAIFENIFSGETIDYSRYLEWQYCINPETEALLDHEKTV